MQVTATADPSIRKVGVKDTTAICSEECPARVGDLGHQDGAAADSTIQFKPESRQFAC